MNDNELVSHEDKLSIIRKLLYCEKLTADEINIIKTALDVKQIKYEEP